jgi:hypothetical protein
LVGWNQTECRKAGEYSKRSNRASTKVGGQRHIRKEGDEEIDHQNLADALAQRASQIDGNESAGSKRQRSGRSHQAPPATGCPNHHCCCSWREEGGDGSADDRETPEREEAPGANEAL